MSHKPNLHVVSSYCSNCYYFLNLREWTICVILLGRSPKFFFKKTWSWKYTKVKAWCVIIETHHSKIPIAQNENLINFNQISKEFYSKIRHQKCQECGRAIVACSLVDGKTSPFCYKHYVDYYYGQEGRLRFYKTAEVQSSEITATGVIAEGEGGESKEEIFQFMDENEGGSIGTIAQEYELYNAAQNQDLQNFLKRPIKIFSFQYATSNNVGDINTINVWRSFLQNQAVKNKLANFAFLRGDLKLKIVVNASPFLYGAVLAAYQPLQDLAPHDLRIADSTNTNWIMEKSQQPHIWIYPQANQGGEMTCPFFFNQNWMNITTLDHATGMGVLDLIVVTKLQSANGVATDTVNISVYAWMENVVLSGPTAAGTLQVKDEYKISDTASALATLAGTFTSIPTIGPFATATQAGANLLAKGLSACGWTNTPNIKDVDPLRPTAFPTLASPEISYPIEKVTIDPKNELGVDPGIVGLGSQDELDISYLVQKESFLGQGVWDTSRAPDDILFVAPVTPTLYSTDSITALIPPITKYHHTPLSWVQMLFNNWRGDIIFRFKFVCSPFHKGRVKIMFDPMGDVTNNIANQTNTDNIVYTTLVDLGKDTDVEFRVPYLQTLTFLRRIAYSSAAHRFYSSGNTGIFYPSGDTTNGMIAVRVVTELTAPVATSSIPFLVSIRGAENFEVANPACLPTYTSKYTMWRAQSSDRPYQTEESSTVSLGETSTQPKHRYLQNYGEHIKSLRQLLRRTTFIECRQFPTVGTNDIYVVGETMTRIPRSYGFDRFGLDTTTGLLSTNPEKFSHVKLSPICWVTNAFVGVRGSVNWTFNVDGQGLALGNITVRRDPMDTAAPKYNNFSGTTTADGSGFAAVGYNYIRDGTAGEILTNQITQSGINVQIPMYNNYNFESADLVRETTWGYKDGSDRSSFSYDITSSKQGTTLNATRVYKYASIGTDYNLHFFLHTPVVYTYNSGGL